MKLKQLINGGVIRCSGPCRKRFQSEIVTEDSSVASVLLSSDPAKSGLFWYCPGCRPLLTAVPSEDEQEDYLPPELWLMIFELLDEALILQTRLTCHQWKEIVDVSRTLHESFCVKFKKMIMDRWSEPKYLPPAAHVTMQWVQIWEVDSWWPWFGGGLTFLELHCCEMALSTLLSILKETPNLKHLKLVLTGYICDKVSNVDFRLERLTDLTCDKVFNVFGQIFPRLIELKVLPVLDFRYTNEKALSFDTVDTRNIEKINVSPHAILADQMSGMSQLKLESMHLEEGIPEEILVQLIQQCPRLENISFRYVNTVGDETVAVVCQLPLLLELTIIKCPITDVSMELISAKLQRFSIIYY